MTDSFNEIKKKINNPAILQHNIIDKSRLFRNKQSGVRYELHHMSVDICDMVRQNPACIVTKDGYKI